MIRKDEVFVVFFFFFQAEDGIRDEFTWDDGKNDLADIAGSERHCDGFRECEKRKLERAIDYGVRWGFDGGWCFSYICLLFVVARFPFFDFAYSFIFFLICGFLGLMESHFFFFFFF